MSNTAIRLQEIDDAELEQFIEIWIERRSQRYCSVERIGAANDKGRDVIGFLTDRKHEGEWDLFQCKRKTRGGSLGTPEAMTELGKLFYHHLEGAYRTLPVSYTFVSPRGVVGPLRDLILNPSTMGPYLIVHWDKYCLTKITGKTSVPLTLELRRAIEAFDFARVGYMTAPMIVKDPEAAPALSKVLGLLPEEAPRGHAPTAIQDEELPYIAQLLEVYRGVSAASLVNADAVLADAVHGEHLRRQRTRYFEAASFRRFHRDNTAPGALETFQHDIYHGVIEVYSETYATGLCRLDAVMKHAGILQTSVLGRSTREPVRQGICHHLANEGRMKWTP
ncbi:ABC-three component system protein [Bradyrhizobium algeriense]|uniref:ABC-three component system protein n=1 Tax=Bradyrhizobium algeriense TaxID=634784 RepID=UPI0011AE65BD|nr:ABC-three component system protein [Bradyrhizobium algeriense]